MIGKKGRFDDKTLENRMCFKLITIVSKPVFDSGEI